MASTTSILAALAVALAAAGGAAGHLPAAPNPTCAGPQQVHDYVYGPALFAVDGNTEDCDGDGDGPDFDGDKEFAFAGGVFPDDHHDATFCASDAMWGSDVGVVVGADGNGDGIIVPDVEPSDHLSPYGLGCVTADFGAGADGTWIVMLSGAFLALTPGFPATTGHIA